MSKLYLILETHRKWYFAVKFNWFNFFCLIQPIPTICRISCPELFYKKMHINLDKCLPKNSILFEIYCFFHFEIKHLSLVGSKMKFWNTTFWFMKVAWLWCFMFHRNNKVLSLNRLVINTLFSAYPSSLCKFNVTATAHNHSAIRQGNCSQTC